MKQHGAVLLVAPSHQERDPKRPRHAAATLIIVLSELECQIAQRLGDGLDRHWLVVREAVLLGLHASVVDEGAGIRSEARHGNAHVRVNLSDLLYGRWLQ